MKFQQGDTIISGPYLILEKNGKAVTPQDHYSNKELARISQVRGSHMILAVVVEAWRKGLRVEARYLVWDNVVASVDDYSLNGVTFLPRGSRDYKMTELLDRENDDVNCMITWLQYDGQQAWIAEHEPEEQI